MVTSVARHHVGRRVPSASTRPWSSTTMRSDERGDDAHHVLDQHDRRALIADAADQVDRLVDLGRREARQHFVQHQQSRRGREAARKLEELGLVQVEVARMRVLARRQPGEARASAARRASRACAVERRAAEHRGERDVVAHREVRERPRNLVGARDAGARDPVRGPARRGRRREGRRCRRRRGSVR